MYVGRFAPTPSGRLHLGSLLAAACAWLRARQQHGRCLLRLEDLDRPRCREEYKQSILQDLDNLGLHFDGEPLIQTDDLSFYQQNVTALSATGRTFFCSCSRRQIRERPCTCRERGLRYRRGTSLKLDCSEAPRDFVDERLGPIHLPLLPDSLTLRRSDNIYSYNLACVTDDLRQGITEVVRGSDLISSTPLQIYLYRLLGRCAPKFLHLPLITSRDGSKLSKQNHAMAVLDSHSPRDAAVYVLRLLQQDVSDYDHLSLSEIWPLAARRFNPGAIPRGDIVLNA